MGGYSVPQQVIIETVRETSIWTKLAIATIPVILGVILTWFIKKRR
jgi:hypothetical protein